MTARRASLAFLVSVYAAVGAGAATPPPEPAPSPSLKMPASPRRPFVLEDILAFRGIGTVSVTGDGTEAAFSVRDADLAANRFRTHLYFVPLDRPGAATALTFGSGSDTRPKWSPDGEWLGFLSDRSGSKQVWAMARRGGEPRPLTVHAQAISDFEWTPDGRRLVVTASDPESADETRRRQDRDDGYLLGEEWRNDRLWIVEVGAAPAPLRPITDGRRHVREGAVVSPDGRRVAFVSTPTAEEDAFEEETVQIVDLDTRTVADVPGADRGASPAWSPDGRRLAFIRPFDGRGISRADLFLWAGGTAAARDLSAPLDREVEDFRFAPDGRAVDLLVTEGAAHALARVEIGASSEAAPAAPRVVWSPGYTLNTPERAGKSWVFVRGDRPAEIWRVTLPGEPRALTAINESAARIDLPATTAIRWRGPDGPLEGVVIVPPGGKPPARAPLVLRPHGGPRLSSTLDLDPTMLYLASQGYVVLKPNFRGSTGYGDAFIKGNVNDWGEGPWRDVQSGADELARRGWTDPARTFLYGWSYSGYLANWAITHGARLRAAVSGAGVADLRMQYILSDARRWRFDYFGGSPFTGHGDVYTRLSPITYAKNAGVPTLFINGERDERCPLPQSLMMHRALRDAGVPTELLIHPREGHDYTEPRHILDRARRAAEWFARYDAAAAGAPSAAAGAASPGP